MDFPSATVQQALNSLASCIRCRERRVGCDRLLPSCQACAAIGAECELYDHVLDAKFPRSYLQQLHLRLQHLEQLQHQLQHSTAHVSRQPRSHTVPSLPTLQSSSSLSDVETQSAPDSLPLNVPGTRGNNDDNEDDDEEDEDDDDDETRGEWGPSSSLAHLRLVADLLNIELHRPLYQALSFKVDVPLTQFPPVEPPAKPPPPPPVSLPPLETSRFLLEFYYNSIDAFMPILGRPLGDRDLATLYTLSSPSHHLRARTRAHLALAIAARCLFRSAATAGNATQSQAYLALSDSLFAAAASSLDAALGDAPTLLDAISPSAFENDEAHAMAKLQIVLLLSCYVLCAPRRGNVWQLLGFAERLWRNVQNARAAVRRRGDERSERSEQGEQGKQHHHQQQQPNLLYCSFVSLERMVGMAYGRPIDFLDFADADDPTHAPGDTSVPALHAAILDLKQSVHAAFLAAHREEPDGPGGGILGPAPGTPRAGSAEWYAAVKQRAEAWFGQWTAAVEAMPREASPGGGDEAMSDSRRHFLLSTGRKWRDEALHLAFCLVMAAASPSQAQPQLLSPDLLAEGREVVRLLVQDYAYLLRQPFTITHAGAQIPLVFPRHWVFDLEVFRAAVTAAWLARQGGEGASMTWEVANCVKLLASTSAEVDAEGLCEAILALVEGER